MTSVDVHYRLDGPESGPTVVLANSLGATLEMWDPQVAELAQRFRVVRYDHRGHGRSPVPDGPYQISDLAGDVLALLDRLQIDRAHFCGLSLGGMVGMQLAATAPEYIDRLVLCCTAARLGPEGSWVNRAAAVRARGAETVADTVVGRWFTPEYAAREPDLVRRMRAMIAATPAEGYAACCDAIQQMDLEPALGSIRAPTLVLAGDRDPATPPQFARAMVSGLPDANLVIVEDAAHLANVQQAAVVTSLILEHLEDRPR